MDGPAVPGVTNSSYGRTVPWTPLIKWYVTLYVDASVFSGRIWVRLTGRPDRARRESRRCSHSRAADRARRRYPRLLEGASIRPAPHLPLPISVVAFSTIDLNYRGYPEYIAVALFETADGLVLVDPGPAVSLPELQSAIEAQGFSFADVRHLLITHIHLDHAGASGPLVRSHPELVVYVSQRGAPHMIDPSRLLASATRLYGERMAELWGEVLPIPADRVRPLAGGETLAIGGRTFDVASTPGHALHHLAYFDRLTSTVFMGDTAGERFPSGTPVIPTTPPPDIDLEAWRESIARVRAWSPQRVFVTHFGGFDDAAAHFDEHDRALEVWAERVRASLREPGTDEERTERFVAWAMAEVTARSTALGATRIHRDAIADCWTGLARYWRKKE
jgi:glyoxylase-like metal-dependent hydrolase (beta-lactamase superfamily II)